MNILLWILQGLTGLLYGSSGVMKLFLFDKVSKDVPSFGALPRGAWAALGVFELLATAALILPGLVPGLPRLPVVAAALLAVESLLFIWVHVKYKEVGTIVVCAVLGVVMAFIAYGRLVLRPF